MDEEIVPLQSPSGFSPTKKPHIYGKGEEDGGHHTRDRDFSILSHVFTLERERTA